MAAVSSFNYIWMLLDLKPEYQSRGRIDACKRLWESFDIERQRYTYRTIRDKRRANMFVNENPYFAIEDNSHQSVAEPKDYNGSREFEQMVKTGTLVTANHNGKIGIYSETDAVAFKMSIIKHLKP